MCHPATCFNLVPVLMQLASYLNMTASKQSMVFTRDGNSSLRLGLESHLSRINKDLGLDLDS